MLRTNLFIATTLVASFASAQIAQTGAVPAPPPPALITTVATTAGDSPMVQAAKRAVAARSKTLTVKIDNYRVRNSTKVLTTSSSGGAIPSYAPQPVAEVQASDRPTVDHAAQQRVQQMQQDLARAVYEEDQGPYSDGQEDRSQQNLNTIPAQLEQSQRPPQ